jgi:hypothetical protein
VGIFFPPPYDLPRYDPLQRCWALAEAAEHPSAAFRGRLVSQLVDVHRRGRTSTTNRVMVLRVDYSTVPGSQSMNFGLKVLLF